MIRYPHFAHPKLFLLNGYQEEQTEDGTVFQYKMEDRLEHCVRRVAIRRPSRLRGWDMRFLRRGLEMSQAEFGQLVDRDAQTIARLEKSNEIVPKPIDLMVRARFAERFERGMQIDKLLGFLDGTSTEMPTTVILKFDGVDWSFEELHTIEYQPTIIGTAMKLTVSRRLPHQIINMYATTAKSTQIKKEQDGSYLVPTELPKYLQKYTVKKRGQIIH